MEDHKLGILVSHRNSVRRVWMEKRRNNGGEFLQTSFLENLGGVKFVMFPAGKRREGWESLRASLTDLLGRRFTEKTMRRSMD